MISKRILQSALLSVSLLPGLVQAQSSTPAPALAEDNPTFQLKGQVSGQPRPIRVELFDAGRRPAQTIATTTTDAAGRFELRGPLPEAAVYLLRLDTLHEVTSVPLTAGDALTLNLEWKGGSKKPHLGTTTLTGSPDAELLQRIRKLSSQHPIAFTKLLMKQQTPQNNAYAAAVRQLIRQSPASQVAAECLLQRLAYYPDQLPFVDSMVAVYRQTLPASRYTQKLAGYATHASAIQTGKAAPALQLRTPAGTPLDWNSLRGRYVLLDFWASWCGPCRQQTPDMLARYRRFQPKGLEIVGVSLDQELGKWTRAVEVDKLPWPQGSDLKGWQSPAATTYGILAIPHTVLLDPQGNIVANGLSGKELDAKLNEVLR